MGLAAPRRKNKYDIDPRNNTWANDDNKFGQKLMEKFGWEKGKGLGAQEDGETQNIKVKVKNDKQGIGANLDYSDTWLDHQDDFNSVLAALNTCHSAPGSGTATPPNEESKDAVEESLEERSKTSKSRVHYKKFTQSKDLTRANASDLDALFGRRKKFEKRSKKGKKAAQSEPASPFAGMTPLGTTPDGGNSPRTGEEASSSDPPAPDGSHDKEYDHDGNLRTVTSSLSVSDYFAKKMAEIKAKRNGVSTAVDQFCENSCKQFKEKEKEEEEEEWRKKEAEKEAGKDVETDIPEVYAQEKFQKASLTVQQYFELKMKEKKSKSTLAESDEPFGALTANDGAEDKKGAKEVSPSDVENNNVDSSATKKRKKKKKAEDIPTFECEKTESGNDVEGESERKKKKKKRKLEDGSKKAEVNATEMDQAEPPKKKKKKKSEISDESTTSKPQSLSNKTLAPETQTLPNETPSEIRKVEKKKKKTKKKSLEVGPESGHSEPEKVQGVKKQPSESDGIPEKKRKKTKKNKIVS